MSEPVVESEQIPARAPAPQSFDVTVIIPFLNEEDNIEQLGTELSRFAASHSELSIEFILVNDGSTDRSVEVIRRTRFPPATRLINLSQNYGSHAALRAGIQHARGEHVTFLYADLQDPIDNVLVMHRIACEGMDIIWAHRSATQNSLVERLFSRAYARMMQMYVNPRYPDRGFDVVMFNRKVAEVVNRNVESNSSVFLQILNLGFRQDFIEYQKVARKAGRSKWTLGKKIKLLIDSFIAFSFAPIRLVSLIGILFFVVGLGWTIYIIYRKLRYDDLAAGWPALVSILMIGFGITNISLGTISEYLWRILDASRRRPVYIVDELVELGG